MFQIPRKSLLTLLAAWVISTPVLAELPGIRLSSIFPLGAKAGSEVEVTVGGSDFEEAKVLHFSHAGITAAFKASGKFTVKVAGNVPPGLYDIRAVGLFGISNPRVFTVSDRPELIKPKAHQQPEAALPIELGSCYSGAATAAAADWFKFTAKKGQRVLIECAAAELDSRLTPAFSVLNATAQELAASRRGGLLDFTVPADGDYLLRVHDLTFAGGPEYFYRLSIGVGPRLDFVLPPAAPAGRKSKFTLYGRNLPGSTPSKFAGPGGEPLVQCEVEIDVPTASEPCADGLALPAAAAIDGFSYRFRAPEGTSNPVFIGFATAPVTPEHEPNDKPAEAQKLAAPCEVAGQFQRAGDTDRFAFEAKKGEVFWIKIMSHRLGHPSNPIIVVQSETADLQEAYGAEPVAGTQRFSVASNDPAVRFAAPADGRYRLLVRDLFGGTRDDPTNVYRLSLRRESPDFRLAALAEPLPATKADRSADPSAPLLRAGGTLGLKVIAFRRDGFAGEIELCAEGLPPGVTCLPTRIVAGKTEGVLLLTAAEKVEPWAGALRVVGKAKIGGAEVVRPARGGTVCWSIKDYNIDLPRTRLTRDTVLAVSGADPAPIAIGSAEEKVWEAPAGGKLEIALKVTRRGEFKEALKLKAEGAPAIETQPEIDIPAGAPAAKATIDLAKVKLPPGAHTIHLQGVTKGKFRGKDVTASLYSSPIRVSVKAPEPKP